MSGRLLHLISPIWAIINTFLPYGYILLLRRTICGINEQIPLKWLDVFLLGLEYPVVTPNLFLGFVRARNLQIMIHIARNGQLCDFLTTLGCTNEEQITNLLHKPKTFWMLSALGSRTADLMSHYYMCYNDPLPEYVPELIAFRGSVDVVEWYILQGSKINLAFISRVVRAKNVDLLRKLATHKIYPDQNMFDTLFIEFHSLGGDTDTANAIAMIDCLVELGLSIPTISPYSYKILDHIVKKHNVQLTLDLWRNAVCNNHAEIVQYYKDNAGPMCSISLGDVVNPFFRIPVATMLYNLGLPPTDVKLLSVYKTWSHDI